MKNRIRERKTGWRAVLKARGGSKLMKRSVTPELLDTDSGSAAEVAESLKDLGRIHRWFGGVSTTEALMFRIAKNNARNELSLLDVASGSGELPFMIRDRLRRQGIELKI